MAEADPKPPRSPAAARKRSRHSKGGNVFNLKGEALDGNDDGGVDRQGARPDNPGSFLDHGGPSLSYRKRP